jgi:hypothetical protein
MSCHQECRQAYRQLAVRQDDWRVVSIMVGAGSGGLSNEKGIRIQLHAVDTVHGRRKGVTPDDGKKLAGLVHRVGADESMNDRAQEFIVSAVIQALVEHKAVHGMSVGKCENPFEECFDGLVRLLGDPVELNVDRVRVRQILKPVKIAGILQPERDRTRRIASLDPSGRKYELQV